MFKSQKLRRRKRIRKRGTKKKSKDTLRGRAWGLLLIVFGAVKAKCDK